MPLILTNYFFFQDFYGFLLNPSSTDKDLDRANHMLYSLILDHLNQLHNGKQFHLSLYDNCNLPEVLSQRAREEQYGTCPLANADIGINLAEKSLLILLYSYFYCGSISFFFVLYSSYHNSLNGNCIESV